MNNNSKVFMKKLLVLFLLFSVASARYIIYFEGIGCPHCAKADGTVFGFLETYPNLTIVEYEVYQNKQNGQILLSYCEKYNILQCGIPLVIINESTYLIGDNAIISSLHNYLNSSFSREVNISSLPGEPRIWMNNSILIKKNDTFLYQWNGPPKGEIEPVPVQVSGHTYLFENAKIIKADSFTTKTQNLTLLKIVTLALVDAINPCALSVLTLILITIGAYGKKRKILLSGFLFALSVFITYFFYGIIITKFFQFIQAIAPIRLVIYKLLGVVAIVLGLLQIKDFFVYKPGGFMTEMPLSLRPKVGKLIKNITSPIGSFFMGFFITLFLLPCTIGPYVITGGILSEYGWGTIFLNLFVYNLIFISPMIGITLLVYIGVSKATEVKDWRKQNVKKLHLIAGLIMFLLGISIVFGLI